MLSVTSGATAPRSAHVASAPSQAKSDRVVRALRADLADAQARLASALVSGNNVSEWREEVANLQASLGAFESKSATSTSQLFVSAGRVAIGVSAQSIAFNR
ncbi:MAG: hypothetical protein KDB07_05520 [Planctomycetes bacterium]|nr:hypothetical protein [Planctomycetota bacterium]